MKKQVLIAERVLVLEGEENVIVRLWAPVLLKGRNKDYSCEFQIIGLGHNQVHQSIGVDGFQAIVLAFETIDYFIRNSDPFKAEKLYWDGRSYSNDLGFGAQLSLAEK